MARYVLPVVGAVIGGIYGGPQGAALGWTIGAAIGGVVDPVELPEVTREGQRLNDLNVSSSAYGAFIPITWGTVRTAGNIIWALPIIEEKTTQTEEQGGKGGPTQDVTTVSYAYFGTFALALGEGVGEGVLRIWADSKLIYSIYDEADRAVIQTAEGGILGVGFDNFTFYPGNETQEPDPLMVLDKGDLTPAHRGLCYIVFEKLPLQQFGNRIPNITCEVSWEGINRSASESYPVPRADVDARRNLVDWDRGRAFSVSNNEIARYDFATGNTVLHSHNTNLTTETDALLGISWGTQSFGAVDPVTGDLWITGQDDNAVVSGSVYLRVDAESLLIIDYVPATSEIFTHVSHHMWPVTIYDSLGQPVHYMVYEGMNTSFPGRPYLVDIIRINGGNSLIGAFFDQDNFLDANESLGTMITGYLNCIPIANRNDSGFSFYMLNGVLGNSVGTEGDEDTEWFIARADIAPLINAVMHNEVIADLSITNLKAKFPDLPWYATNAVHELSQMAWDYGDNSSLIIKMTVENTGGPGEQDFYFKFDVEIGDFVWASDTFRLFTSLYVSGLDNTRQSQVYNATYFADEGANTVSVYDTRDGTLKETIAYPGTIAGSQTFNTRLGLIWCGTTSAPANANEALINIKGGTGDPVAVQTIINDITDKVGLDADTLFTQTTAQTVRSFQLSRLAPARQGLSSLATAFYFDIIESDFGLKVVERGGASAANIPDSDLIDKNEQETFTEQRASEVNLPMRINVTCRDKDLDYQHRTQFVKRVQNPVKAGFSENAMNFAFPMTLEADKAKQIAERLLYTSWSERVSYSFQLPQKYLTHEPTDVVTVQTTNANFEQRLAQTSIGADFSLDISGIATDAAQYVSDSTVGNNLGFRPPSLPGTDLTKYFLLNTPLLRDFDDNGRVADVYYHAASGYSAGLWPGAQVMKSVDNTAYVPIQQVVNESTWGSTLSALPDTDYPFTADEDTVLTVSLVVGSLSSITDAEMLSETSNTAAIIKADGEIEIIQFRDVNNTSGNQYELSYILRGRRGTDYATSGHDSGESIVLLTQTNLQSTPVSLDELNAIRYWKAVAFGADINSVMGEAYTSVGNTLKPYAPVEVASTTDATDIEITWTRRTRVAGSMQDGSGTVPLNEDTEEYEVEIYDDADQTTLLRTATGLTSPSYDYLNADIITDFGSIPAELNVIVYQISAQVGRGFGILRTIEVE